MKTSALYPGSFDCFTYGHLDIIKRALKVFDNLIVGVAVNPHKTTLFSREERVSLIREVLKDTPRVEVISFSGLTIQKATALKVNAIVRGLRMASDFEFEFQMALMNRSMNKHIESIYFPADEKYLYLSSHLVREISMMGGSVSAYLPPVVEKALIRKIKQQRGEDL